MISAQIVRSDVVWLCDECAKPVGDGEGYVHISFSAILARETAREAWAREHPGPTHSANELVAFPSPAAWAVHHMRCDPRPESGDYWIGIERIRFAADLVEWSAHLLEKRWLVETNWAAFLRRALRELAVAS